MTTNPPLMSAPAPMTELLPCPVWVCTHKKVGVLTVDIKPPNWLQVGTEEYGYKWAECVAVPVEEYRALHRQPRGRETMNAIVGKDRGE